MIQRLKLFIPLGIFVVLAALTWQALDRDPTKLESVLVGRTVPQFSLPTVTEPVRILDESIVKGQGFALINIWATWCGPCRQEHPFLVALAEQGVTIFGVNVNDDLTLARQWLAQYGNPYRETVFDSQGKLALDLGVYGYPETFLIDNQGTVLFRRVSVLDETVWQRDFLPLIQQLANKP